MEQKYETHQHDVLVIGAGGAGLRAAIESSAQGAKTALVCKSLLGKAHTVMAEGGIAAAMANVDKRDDWKAHLRDTMLGGNFVNNWRMAQIHAQEAPDRVNELESWGAVFDRTPEGRINQRNFGGHSYPRLAHVGDRTGLEMIRTLQDKGIHSGIDVYMECTLVSLLKDGDRVCGAVGYYRETGKIVIFQAKAVVLATGGIGKAFKINSNSWEYTGDGQALAYHAGADLVDMEFVQFHPTGMIWPPSVSGILITEAVRGEGGVLINKDGKRFMFDYIPYKYKELYADTEKEANTWMADTLKSRPTKARKPPELMSRDVVARAIWNEIKEGRGTEHGGVFLDVASRRSAEDIKKKLPSMYHQFKELADVDITKVPMEIGPTCHYVMGGVRVDPETQAASVPGLYAAGEVAAGLHGSNRLGGNSLSDLLVFGRRAGASAAAFAKSIPAQSPLVDAVIEKHAAEMVAPFNREKGENPYDVVRDLQITMESNAGMFRDEDGLKNCLVELEKLKVRANHTKVEGNRQFNPGWHAALELKSLLTVSEALVRCALERRESRGGHSRTDFPDYAAEFAKVNLALRADASGAMALRREPLPAMPDDIEKLFDPKVLKKLRGEE
ncbi:MAG: fumarate reductase/succinate dehydrogenase flavoprotein subunit [candidate division FCPU426 bacterium]